jgi:membrane protease subunit HflC
MTKKKNPAGYIVLAVILLLLIVILANSLVYVAENKSVLIRRLSKIETVYEEPGLKFKMPFLDVAVSLPKTAMVYDLLPSDVLTVDKKAMTVSSYAVWKIIDPLRFMQIIDNETEAKRRIDMSVYTSVKNLISTMEQTDVISARGLELNDNITANVREQMEAYGKTTVIGIAKGVMERLFAPCEVFLCCDTMQFQDYSRYDTDRWDAPAKIRRHQEFFPQDLERAFDLGRRLVG